MRRPTRSLSRSSLALFATVLLGCGRDTTVLGVADPPPQPCLGPSLFVCGAWSPCQPEAGVAEFDLYVLSATAANAIRQAGGTVLREGLGPYVSARIPDASVPLIRGHAGVTDVGVDGYVCIAR